MAIQGTSTNVHKTHTVFIFFYFFYLFLFYLFFILFSLKKYKKNLKNKNNTKTVCFVYIGTYVPWMAIETKFSKLCIICILDEHLCAQLSK